MASLSKKRAAGLESVAAAFGYPRPYLDGAFEWLARSFEMSRDEESLAFNIEDSLLVSAYWPESVPDEPCPLEEDELSQTRQVLANQLAGAFAYRGGLGFGRTGLAVTNPEAALTYVVDVCDSDLDGLVVVQRQTESGPVGPSRPVLDHLSAHRPAEDEWKRVRDKIFDAQDGVASEDEVTALVDAFGGRFPRLVSELGPLIHDRLARASPEVPALSAQQRRFLETLTASEWAVAALAGDAPADEPEAARAIGGGAAYDAGYVPHLVLRPLLWIAGGDRERGVAEAQRLLDENLGVPLTQRWAKRIVERGGEDLVE